MAEHFQTFGGSPIFSYGHPGIHGSGSGSGEWTPKVLYNFKFVAYLQDPSNNAMGWSGLVRSDLFSDFETLWNSYCIANVIVL